MLFLSTLFLSLILKASAADVYSLATTIPWSPATPGSVDQSIVYNNTYYLADRTNAGIHVIDLKTNKQTALIGGFVTGLVNGTLTSSISGPDGLIILANRDELWVGDGDGTIKVIDLLTNTIAANITTGSKKRADEFAYNPTTGIVVVTNPSEEIPFVTVVNATSRKVVGKVEFTEAAGLEQPAFNPADSQFYISVPDTKAYPGGVLSVIDTSPSSLAITKNISTPDCANAGIVFAGSTNKIFVACSSDQITTFKFERSYIYDVSNGELLANVTGVSGVDQVAYSDFTKWFYASAYKDVVNDMPAPNLAIIAVNGTVLQTIVTDSTVAHAVAVNPADGAMIVPVKEKGILVYQLVGGGGSATSTGSTPQGTSSGAGSVVPNAIMALAVLITFSMMF